MKSLVSSVDFRFARDPLLYSRDDWKHDLRGMPVIVENRVHSDGRPAVVVERLPCVGIDIKPRKIATGDVEADAVTFLENHCGRVHVYRNLIDVSRLHELSMFQRIPVACSNDPVLNTEVKSRRKVVTWWINVNQFGSEIGVGRGR